MNQHPNSDSKLLTNQNENVVETNYEESGIQKNNQSWNSNQALSDNLHLKISGGEQESVENDDDNSLENEESKSNVMFK